MYVSVHTTIRWVNYQELSIHPQRQRWLSRAALWDKRFLLPRKKARNNLERVGSGVATVVLHPIPFDSLAIVVSR